MNPDAAPPTDDPTTGFFLYRSSRVEDLGEAFCQRLAATRPADPIEPQVVVVGSRGMERWLRHRVATRHRVCCNVSFEFPGRALAALVGEVLGHEPPATDPWGPDALAWAILDELPAVWGEPAFDQVRAWLEAEADFTPDGPVSVRAWGWAREVGDAFDRYALFRPDHVATWAGPQPEPAGVPGLDWQVHLWRRLEERLGRDHFTARLEAMEHALSGAPVPALRGRTLQVFGVTSLPPALLRLLSLFGHHMCVELFALVPSNLFWGEFKGRDEVRRLRRTYRDRDRDELSRQLRQYLADQHPLLTSLGRLSRDFQVVIEEATDGYRSIELPDPPDHAQTLLHGLQSDIRRLRARPPAPRAVEPPDRSVEVHACHGPTRQVEVLREVLLQLFAADDSLRPRDVVVMTPDIETYAPLVETVFRQGRQAPAGDLGRGGWGLPGAPQIPVHIADMGLRSINPVADALLRVLELAERRATASGLLDLLALEPVRDRFAFDADDLDTLRGWVIDAGIRWGEDAEDRARAGQPADPVNTFRFGMERLALGTVMADDHDGPWQGVLPFDAIEGDAVGLLGRFLEFLETFFALRGQVTAPHTVEAWSERLLGVVDRLTATTGSDAWLTEQVREQLLELGQRGEQLARPVEPGAIRRALEGRFDLQARGDRPITGAVSVCALTPMRSVPYRVVCTLGMSDDEFPRRPGGRSFDLVQQRPRMGDRDPRDEDRHLFLEALLSARDHFLVFYTGRDIQTNEERPPAGPVSELLDAVDAGWHQGRQHVVHEHPLQPFSRASFAEQPDGLSWSHDGGMHAVAAGLARGRSVTTALFQQPLPPVDRDAPLEPGLDDLVRFLRQPVRHLLRRRLGLYLQEWDDTVADREPVDVDPLTRWSIRRDLVGHALEGREQPAVRDRMRLEGRLPLGQGGTAWFDDQWQVIELPVAASEEHREVERHTVSEAVTIGGTVLRGSVPGVSASGDVLQVVHEDAGKPRHLLEAWVRGLFLAAAGRPVPEVRTIGVKKAWGRTRVAETVLHVPDDPAAHLADLLALYRQGMAGPLPLCEKTSHAAAKALHAEAPAGGWADADPDLLRTARDAAEGAWRGGYNRPGEREKAFLAAVFPDRPPFEPAAPGAIVDDAFVALAEQLWRPLLNAVIS